VRGVLRVDDASALNRSVAKEFLHQAFAAIRERDTFTTALAGGNTPRLAYQQIAATWKVAPGGPVDWSRVHLFWGDERHVTPDDPQSNYRMARQALIDRVPIPPENVHPVQSSLPDPHEAASHYAAEIRDFFQFGPGELPRFDLVLLGMGADGHTASLFPGSGALDARERLAVAAWIEKVSAWRITLTLPVINNAANVMVLVSGREKAETLRAVLEGPEASPPLPAQRIRPTSGSLLWIVDREAASLLT
jgi:6-phosphogluconolactonase